MKPAQAACIVLALALAASESGLHAQRGPQHGGQPSTPPPSAASPAPSSRLGGGGRLFAAQDLGLLEGPDREQWQKSEQIMDALRIADGSVVAELGAAGGWFTIKLARRAAGGIVYAEDIQPEMIERIGRHVKQENLSNVHPILGTPNDPRLPPGIDAVLIVQTFAEMQLPPTNPVQLLKKTAESLKPDGRIGIVDFNPGAGGPGPTPEQRVDPMTVINAATAAGLHLVARESIPPFQFLLVFEKNPAARPKP